jgi:hypothetical protein
MKRVLTAVVFVAALLVGGHAFAQSPNQSGFGIGIGSSNMASGLSLKSATGATAYQFVVGAWRGGWVSGARVGPYDDYRVYYDGLGASFDFLLEQPNIASTEPFNLGWNAGLGGGIGIAGNGFFGFGVNGVLGLEFNFNPIPIDLTLEYRPGLYIFENGFGIDFFDLGAHLRFWI